MFRMRGMGWQRCLCHWVAVASHLEEVRPSYTPQPSSIEVSLVVWWPCLSTACLIRRSGHQTKPCLAWHARWVCPGRDWRCLQCALPFVADYWRVFLRPRHCHCKPHIHSSVQVDPDYTFDNSASCDAVGWLLPRFNQYWFSICYTWLAWLPYWSMLPLEQSESENKTRSAMAFVLTRSHIPCPLPIYLSQRRSFVNNYEPGATEFPCPGHQVSGPRCWSRKCREDNHLAKSLRNDRESKDIQDERWSSWRGWYRLPSSQRFRLIVLSDSSRSHYWGESMAYDCDSNVWLSLNKRGDHNIEDELVFTKHDGYVFHDSCGFEAGHEGELQIVQDFVRRKATAPKLQHRLHAIWFVALFPRICELQCPC